MWPRKNAVPELVAVTNTKDSICKIRDAKTQKTLLTISGQNGTDAYEAMHQLITELDRKTEIMRSLNEQLQYYKKRVRDADDAFNAIIQKAKDWQE